MNKVNTRAELRLDLDRATDTAALPRDVADRLTKHSTKERIVVVAAQTARTQKGNREACEATRAALLEAAWHPPTARHPREGISKDGKRARTADKRRRRDVKSNRGRVDYFSTNASPTTLADKRLKSAKELAALPEVVAADTLRQQLASGTLPTQTSSAPPLDADQTKLVIDAGLATFHLHVEARIAAYCGEGFYTIGPAAKSCRAIGLVLEDGDGAALHYSTWPGRRALLRRGAAGRSAPPGRGATSSRRGSSLWGGPLLCRRWADDGSSPLRSRARRRAPSAARSPTPSSRGDNASVASSTCPWATAA